MKNIFIKMAAFTTVFAMAMGFQFALAAAPQNASDNMTRQKVGELSDHVFTFTLPTVTLADATVTFPAGFDLSAASTTVGSIAGQVVTIPNADFTAGTPLTFTVSDVENPGTAGNQSIAIATDLDSGSILIPIVTDDQIRITARVAQTLYFDVRDGTDGTADDNTVGFGDLTSANARYATDDATGTDSEAASSEFEVGTNAASGYSVDVRGETLTSMENPTDQIDALLTPAASTAGTEQFGIQIARTQDSTGLTTGVVVADYATNYHLPDSGVAETVATNANPASNEIYDVNYLANIAALTPAGNYATTLTFTATANF